MKPLLDFIWPCQLPYEEQRESMAQVLESTHIHKFFLTGNYAAEAAEALAADPCVTLCGNLAVESTKFLRQITPKLTAKYTMVWL